jgi:hypothetical protein
MKTANFDYSFYLFVQLRMLYAPSELPYDITYTTDLNEYEWFLVSDYNKDTEPEYECMVAYLKDKFAKPERYKFPRKCDITGNGFSDGYCIGDGDMYIKYEQHMINHLRGLDWEDADGRKVNELNLSDKDLLEYFYNEEYYYYSDWEVDEDDEWYESDSEYGINAILVQP